MITYKKGNLLDTPDSIIVQGVNCQGVMGSGVAKAIREKWPVVFTKYTEYSNKFRYARKELLGQVNVVEIEKDEKIIANIFSQENYGKTKFRYVSYDALDKGFTYLTLFPKGTNISMPKIGAGLGGGEWSIIEAIINFRLKDFNVTVYTLD